MIHLITHEPGPAPVSAGKFPLGRVVATPGALTAVPLEELQAALGRHQNGDWGDLCDEDRKANVSALTHGERLVSVYRTKAGVKFYIITEHDRSVTTVLLPDEYKKWAAFLKKEAAHIFALCQGRRGFCGSTKPFFGTMS